MSCKSQSTSSRARERELYRYYTPSELDPTDSDDLNPIKQSSSDPCLTAFAQLGVLRLNAKRGFISLATRDSEYILAESGQELSLQQDDDENDKLWHGVGLLRSKVGIGIAAAQLFSEENAPEHVLVGDLTQDERFKDKPGVLGELHLRSLACVPLKSVLHGMVIGTYIIVDDKKRAERLTDSECQFLTDMATTVADYLEANRLKTVQHRSERMIKAIGLFIEGKSTLRDWWMERGHKFQSSENRKRTRISAPLEDQADAEFGVQETIDNVSRNGLHDLENESQRASIAASSGAYSTTPSVRSGTPSVHSATESSLPRSGNGLPALPTRDTLLSISDGTTPQRTTFTSRSWEDKNSSVTTLDNMVEPTPDLEKQPSVSFNLPPEENAPIIHPESSHELQNSLLSSDVRSVFARASNLIREAIGVDGVIYLDASVGSFGGSANKNVMDETAPGAFHQPGNAVATDEEDTRQTSSTDSEKTGPDSENYCNVLGYSTRKRSSVHGHRVADELQKFPEAIMRKLLKRYPFGKVWNLDDDGVASLSESESRSSATEKPSSNPETDIRRRISREQEAAAIISALPGACSVFWFPLWDQNRERGYAGSLVWSTRISRTLCPEEDFTYLAAFGNSTMAEIARISAQVLVKMKTDFISSISHELRSPLHGVLASVEFLQETEMTEQQVDMVNNIHASGKVLLDTINHVLDFSKVNRKTKNNKRISKRLRKDKNPTKDIAEDEAEKADICIVSEEVIESIYAGEKASKKAFSRPEEHKRRSSNGDRDAPVTVIMDVAWRKNWTFEFDKGAWRRILMNIFTNAMKYTDVGFVKVSLEIEDDPAPKKHHHSKKNTHSNLILRVKDSGKGISQDFLNHQLYRPFTQEDNLASGAGLGLSIVKAIVHDMGGKIEFFSEPGTGTEVVVRLPLVQSVVLKKLNERKAVQEVRDICTGKKVGLVGFDRYPDLKEEPTGILDRDAEAAMLLKETVKDTLKDWYGIETVFEKADLLVVMESCLGEKSLTDVLEEYDDYREKRVAIVLTSGHHSGPKTDVHDHFRIFYLQLPFGPHNVGRILHQAFCISEGDIERRGHSRAMSEVSTSAGIISPTSETRDFAGPAEAREVSGNGKEKRETPHLWTPGSNPMPAPLPPSKHFSLPTSSMPLAFSLSDPTSAPPLPASNEKNTTIPPTAQSYASIPPESAEPAPGIEAKAALRVLLVEDNEINLKLLIATMQKLKLEHATAMNGLEALNAYKECKGKFDVVFMDISMPIMSGIESTRHIRRFEHDHSLPPTALIALTGAGNANTRQEAFSVGVDLFLTKPVPMKALRGMLDDLGREGRGFFAA